MRRARFNAVVAGYLRAAPSVEKEENQPRFAVQASVFSCPFLHVHQSAKPDVQMLCVGKQALVWANTASTHAFWWA